MYEDMKGCLVMADEIVLPEVYHLGSNNGGKT